ncbi:S41 family peptidase, partial [Bacteroidota bacterium]
IVVGIQIQNIIVNSQYDENFQKFSETYNFVKQYYVDSVNSDKLIEASIKGMFDELDPYTVYIPEAMQHLVEEEMNGAFEGIGIEFQVIDDTITVVSAITGGPSEKVGLEPGDKIIKVEGESCIGLSNSEVMEQLKGEKNTEVNITIFRPYNNEMMNFHIIRDEIPINAVDAAFMYNDSVAYVSLTRFAETSEDEIKSELDRLKSLGMKKLILDLRNNPGGLLSQAYKIADLFISGEKLIVYTRGRISDYNEELFAELDYPYENIPLILLVNKGSASASEIVAGAVQDWDRGIIVGEQTYGKGLVQRPLVLDDNSAIRVTISKYFTPSGREIQKDYSLIEDDMDDHDGISESQNVSNNLETQKDSLSNTFKTANGRTVYGGGGITPDYIVSNENLTNYTLELRRSNVYYQFIRKFMNKNVNRIDDMFNGSLREFKRYFKLTDKDMNDFIKFAESKKVEYNKTEYLKDKKYIYTRLKAFIARERWRNEGWYLILLDEDTQFKKAIEISLSDVMFDTVN